MLAGSISGGEDKNTLPRWLFFLMSCDVRHDAFVSSNCNEDKANSVTLCINKLVYVWKGSFNEGFQLMGAVGFMVYRMLA